MGHPQAPGTSLAIREGIQARGLNVLPNTKKSVPTLATAATCQSEESEKGIPSVS